MMNIKQFLDTASKKEKKELLQHPEKHIVRALGCPQECIIKDINQVEKKVYYTFLNDETIRTSNLTSLYFTEGFTEEH